MRGGGLGVHLVLSPVRLPLLPLNLGLVRGVEVSLDVRLLRSVSSAPSGAAEREVARSQRTSPARTASSVASPCSSQHAPRRDELREVSVDRSLSRSSRVSRSADRGTRKDRRACSQSDSSCNRGRRSHSRSAYRSRLSSRERRLLCRCPPASSRDLWIAPAPVAFALSLRESGLDVTGRGLLTATDPVDSVRDPLLAVEVAVTVRGHAISLVVLVTARGPVDDLPPLTVRDQRREDGEPDVSSRRVWRWLLSPRLLLSLKRLL